MALSHEHAGPKILAKIKIYILTRAELLCHLCYEIPCICPITVRATKKMWNALISKIQFCGQMAIEIQILSNPKTKGSLLL
jgi:hypothetical protein